MQLKYAGRLIALLAVAILARCPRRLGRRCRTRHLPGHLPGRPPRHFAAAARHRPVRAPGRDPSGRFARHEGEDLDKPLGPQDVDPSVQDWIGAGEIPRPWSSFNGHGNISSVSPPDPVGDVGPNHYVAMSNLSFQIFDKSRQLALRPGAQQHPVGRLRRRLPDRQLRRPDRALRPDRGPLDAHPVHVVGPDLLQLRGRLADRRSDRRLLPLGLQHRHQLPGLSQVRLLVRRALHQHPRVRRRLDLRRRRRLRRQPRAADRRQPGRRR